MSTRSAPGSSGTAGGWTRARCRRRVSWRTCSPRSGRCSGGSPISRRSSSTSWSGGTRQRAAEAERAQIAADREAATARRDAATAEIDEQAAKAQDQRSAVAAGVPADLLALYEQLRAQYGVGAAALRGGQCQGCHLSLNTVDLNAIRAAAPDEVVR